ncbi:MAG: hypothetical protein A2289_03430 [Deltaproteobacteria bacterium RIFOXYA12_FULL_58_15]|nr:MAG: hypothetical protein A2289_03430 [Deltaproteobacteria bacterium RIFOXYA12_FULL_58_15]OGR14238.1 MAG: hypothetical protein A2341_13525 [Deltaproteobacteria bacterium RIFOXYB12_FULL_58_9]
MIRRLKRVLLIAAIALFCLAGLLILVVALIPQVVIGEGQLENWVRGVETFDFKWWIVAGAAALWLFPAFATIVGWPLNRLARGFPNPARESRMNPWQSPNYG